MRFRQHTIITSIIKSVIFVSATRLAFIHPLQPFYGWLASIPTFPYKPRVAGGGRGLELVRIAIFCNCNTLAKDCNRVGGGTY